MTALAGLPEGYVAREAHWDDPDVVALRAAMGAEVMPLYADDDLSQQKVSPPSADDVIVTLALSAGDGPAVATASLLRVGEFTELKRVMVLPEHRRKGLASWLVAAIEDHARRLGLDRIVLQTGFRQTGAIALYEASGWTRIPPFGPYAGDEVVSVCFAKELRDG